MPETSRPRQNGGLTYSDYTAFFGLILLVILSKLQIYLGLCHHAQRQLAVFKQIHVARVDTIGVHARSFGDW